MWFLNNSFMYNNTKSTANTQLFLDHLNGKNGLKQWCDYPNKNFDYFDCLNSRNFPFIWISFELLYKKNQWIRSFPTPLLLHATPSSE